MAQSVGGGYNLRSRKKMTPDGGGSGRHDSSEGGGANNHVSHPTDRLGNGSVPQEEILHHRIHPTTTNMDGVIETNIDSEEDVLFDKSDDNQPLLPHEDSSQRVEFEIEEDPVRLPKETWFGIALQVFFPYIIAGFGTVGAGMVLDIVQHWSVFVHISEVFILVPSLLGLKGNLEMTLASRLSTQANLGNLDDKKEMWKLIGGNLALVQAQAIVVGFLASLVAMIMGWIPEGKFDIHHGFLLGASSMLTAAVASFALGALMVVVVVISKKLNINPDNVATPIAASLGDLTTLALLAAFSNFLYNALGNQHWIAPTIMAVLVVLAPLWLYVSVKNKYTHEVVYSGWTPVLSAMVISSIGGLILDFMVANFKGIAVFQPVINGVGGNLVAVHASRITTSLHLTSTPGRLPRFTEKGCPNPVGSFCGKTNNGLAARVLLSLVIPGHLIFIFAISWMKAGHTSFTITFVAIYLTAAMLQVVILLYLAHWLVHFVWKLGDDPDNVAIPYLTAIGDLLGTLFLAVAFQILYAIGDKDADVGE